MNTNVCVCPFEISATQSKGFLCYIMLMYPPLFSRVSIYRLFILLLYTVLYSTEEAHNPIIPPVCVANVSTVI